MRSVFILSLLICCLSSFTGVASPTGTESVESHPVWALLHAESVELNDPFLLVGTVTNRESGEPVPGATVSIESLNLGVATDPDGRFRIDLQEEGHWLLEIRSMGYVPQRLEVSTPLHEPLSISLQPILIEGEDVVITASPLGRNIRYQPAQAINRRELQERAAPSLGEILDGNPGVAMRSFGSAPARPVIRGMDGDRVLILQNGERMGDLSATAHDHAIVLDPLAIDRVEVVRGPASLIYGSSAIGGVINLYSYDMPREWTPGHELSIATQAATVNSLGAVMARGGYGEEKWAVSGRTSFRGAGDIRTPEGVLEGSFLNSRTVGAGAGYRSGSVESGLSVDYMDYRYGLPEELNSPDEEVRLGIERLNLQGMAKKQMDGLFTLGEVRFQFNHYLHDEMEIVTLADGLSDESLELGFEQNSFSSTLTLRHRPLGRWEGAVGFHGFWREIRGSGEELLTPDASNLHLAAFLYEEFELNPVIRLQAGGRLEFQQMQLQENRLFHDLSFEDDRSDLVTSGSIGFNFQPHENWEAGIQLARAFRPPSLEELYSDAPHVGAGAYEIGNRDLQNEISLGSDLFVDYTAGRVRVELAGFLNRIRDFIKYTPTGQVHEPSGLPIMTYEPTDALIYGFEFSARYILSHRLRAGVVIDYLEGSESTAERAPLPFMTPLRTALSLRYEENSWWAGARLRRVHRQHRVAPNEDPTDGYLLLGVDGGVRFRPDLSLAIRLDNALDIRYRDHLSRIRERNNPMPGRNLNLILRWDI